MKVGRMLGERFKEAPKDCVIASHALMMRGGYMKYVGNGIYSLFTPAKRITSKIEKIIREEMDRIDGEEVLFPVVMPATLWQQSGRFESVGSELVRLKDRNGNDMVLGMTHEEAAVHLARDTAKSYADFPFMIYQIQTKFRDEARPRAGLIRVREFTMKDAYSFHTSQEDLERYYEICYDAYLRIFARVGVPEVVAVKSDSGMMGGSISHEYMLLTPIGEDSIAICEACDYKANMEAADNLVDNSGNTREAAALEKVYTPDLSTIDDVTKALKLPIENTCKAVVYQKNSDDSFIVVFMRGDMEANETKITNYIGEGIHPANIEDDSVLVAGFIGPYQLNPDVTVLYDRSLKGIEYMSCGANERDYHYIGLNLARDLGQEPEFHDFTKIRDGGICPKCGKPMIRVHRGIEVGNIFQLGTKYTKSMGMKYIDKNNEEQYPIMGCYGIGIGRLAASVCEAHHDAYGPIWPITIAPWEVHICCLRVDDEECREYADNLYRSLQRKQVEVIYDDRDIRPGAMFSDADLLGVPVRVVVSPRNMKENHVEIVTRDKRYQFMAEKEQAEEKILELIDTLKREIMEKVPQ